MLISFTCLITDCFIYFPLLAGICLVPVMNRKEVFSIISEDREINGSHTFQNNIQETS